MPLNKPWAHWRAGAERELPGNLGVYELGDAEGRILYIGFAGGRSRFGIRGVLAAHFSDDEPNVVLRERAALYRFEANQMYWTRWLELLARYRGEHGHVPDGNEASAEPVPRLGRIG
jgi:hypothetical protein